MDKNTEAKYHKRQPYLGFLGRFPEAVKAVTEVSEFGVKKHNVPMGDMSYLDIPDAANVYREALVRHLVSETLPVDIESGLLHAAHEAWNAMARLECILRRGEKND